MLYDISLLKLFYVRTLNVLSGEKPSWFFLLYLCSSVSEETQRSYLLWA